MLTGPPAPPPRHGTLVAALAAARGAPGALAFVDARERERRLGWDELVDRACRAAGALIERGVRPGDRVAIVLRTGPAFVDACLGAILAHAVPVPLYPPLRLGELARYHAATARMLEVAGARAVVTDRLIGGVIADALAAAPPRLGVLDAAALAGGPPIRPTAVAPGALALIQFSSGTTVDPKPVALTHGGLVAHLETLRALVEPGEARALGVSWLPLYHDMGLIGCLLLAAYAGGELVLIPPELFLARPALWLRAIARHRATVSAAPSFAYGLAARRIGDDELAGVDLASWWLALDGAEQVSPAVARRFTARFARRGLAPGALTPVYGLSEATLAVTFSPAGRGLVTAPDGGREVASVGRPIPGVDVDVRDGRIFVRGPSLMHGYLGQPDATAAAVGGDGWLDTGDLGFVHGGELYVTGRAKDVVVVRGANHHPAAIEAALDGVPGMRPGCAVAVSVTPADGDGEELLVIAERARDATADVAAGARAAIRAATGLTATVAVVEAGALPRTSSGKLRRREALRRWLAGELRPPRPPGRLRLALRVLRGRLALARLRVAHALR